jgi:hypothetical protein
VCFKGAKVRGTCGSVWFFLGNATYLDTFSASLRTLGKRITGEKLCCLCEFFESLRLNFFSTAQKLGLAITNELNAMARRKSKCAGCFKVAKVGETCGSACF